MSTTPTDSSTPSFSQQDFVVGKDPAAVLVTDLNGDGLPDIAVSNLGDGTVTILLNTTAPDAPAATFSAKTFEASGLPTLMVAGDFNGDGQTDLAVQGEGVDSLTVLVNNTLQGSSTPQFTTRDVTTNSDFVTVNMVAADFLGNGLSDLASSSIDSGFITMTTNTTATSLTAEVEEDPASGSGSFSIQSPASTVLNSNTWYYVAFTYAPNVDSNGDDQLTLYVNGQMVTQSTGTGSLPSDPDISGSSTFDLLVGAQPGTTVSKFFSGYLDDVSIWPEALTETEIQALYGGGMVPTYVQTVPTNPDTYTALIASTTDLVEGDNFGAFDSATITGSITGTPVDSSTSEPLSQWTVNLLDSQDDVIATTETGSDGSYFFFGVLPGTYTIEQVLETGWEQSTPADSAGITVTAAEGTEYTDEDFANTQVAQVMGTVYIDANNNGREDPGELPASGIAVDLDLEVDGTSAANGLTTVTQADGVFNFTGLAPGRYVVRVSAAALGVTTQPSPAFYIVDITARRRGQRARIRAQPAGHRADCERDRSRGIARFVTGDPFPCRDRPTDHVLSRTRAPAGATIDPSTGEFAWTPPTPGSYTVTVDAVAAGTPLLFDSQTFTVVVSDVAPVVHLGPNVQLTQGQPFNGFGSFTDPGTDPWTAVVDYGDGQGPQPLILGLNKTFDLDHIYANPGSYVVTVVISDGFGGVGSAQITVLVIPGPIPPALPLSSGFGAGRDAFVTSFYGEVLGEAPNQASLSFWSGLLLAGKTPLAVARRIWNSPDHRALEHEALAPAVSFGPAYRHALRVGKTAARMQPATHSHSGSPAG